MRGVFLEAALLLSAPYLHKWGFTWTARARPCPASPSKREPQLGWASGPRPFPHTQASPLLPLVLEPQSQERSLSPASQGHAWPCPSLRSLPGTLATSHPSQGMPGVYGLGQGPGLEASSAPPHRPLILAGSLFPALPGGNLGNSFMDREILPPWGTACSQQGLDWGPQVPKTQEKQTCSQAWLVVPTGKAGAFPGRGTISAPRTSTVPVRHWHSGG